MTPDRATLLDAADTEAERGNCASAAKLRERAAALEQPWERLQVTVYEPGRYLCQSQTQYEVEYVVEPGVDSCTCPWSMDFKKEDGVKKPCAHLKRVRQWLAEQ